VSAPNFAAEILAAARALVRAAARRDPSIAGSTISSIGWATVELDRAERELRGALGRTAGAEPWVRAGRDDGLGAAARLGPPLDGGPRLVLLEADTEGRLAATLARHGEGVAAVYVRTRAGADLVIVPALTSALGGRPPTVLAGRPPSAAG
jgi:hypothetical protein